MNERWLVSSFTASSLIHLGIIPLAALVMHAKPIKPAMVPIELVDVPRFEEPKKVEVHHLLQHQNQNRKKSLRLNSSPNRSSKPARCRRPVTPRRKSKRSRSNSRSLHCATIAAPRRPAGTGLESSRGGRQRRRRRQSFWQRRRRRGGGQRRRRRRRRKGTTGLGRGAKGDGTGGGTGSGEALSGLARPLGGYQVKPRYPESARRAGVQGVTTLRVRVLENGRVGDVIVDQSAGFRDLDIAAVDAVKKWLFEPARQGKNPVSVWVLLPVKFELH